MTHHAIVRQGVVLMFLGAFLSPAVARAQEHPEHPTEHPENADTKPSLTKEGLAKAIKDYVAADTKAKGGYFLVFDTVAEKPLALTLDHVHEERLSGLGGGVYFACADFTSPEGTTYDIDVFMMESEAGLEATEVHVHKVDGKPRYSWKEQGGVWVREKVK
jgi:hypothetical protein